MLYLNILVKLLKYHSESKMNAVLLFKCVCVSLADNFCYLDNMHWESVFKQIRYMSVAQLFSKVRGAQLVRVCTSSNVSVSTCTNVGFNVLTYATPYKQCFMQTVAELPSDKNPEQEKVDCLVRKREWGLQQKRNEWGWRVEAMWERSTKCLETFF